MWGIRKWGMILENTKNTKNVFKMFLFHIHKKHAQMMVIGMAWMELNLRKPCPKLKNIQNTLRKQGFLTFFFNFDNFSKFVPFWGNSSAKTQQFYL